MIIEWEDIYRRRVGGYKTILVDPPWQMQVYGKVSTPEKGYLKGRKSLSEKPYKTMSISEIKKLPISKLATEGSHLWLWCTHDTLHDAFHILEAWHFKYQVCLTWIKPTGFGNWWRKTTQFLLFAYRSPLKMSKRMQKTDYNFIPEKHSKKPEKSFELIELISEPPRIEIFAREIRDGWDSLGDELNRSYQKRIS